MTKSIVNDEAICVVSPETVAMLKERARTSPYRGFRLCLHHSVEHPVQEMLIVMYDDTYWRPHRHPGDLCESYAVVEGALRVFFFDDDGTVNRIVDLAPPGGDKPFLYRLSTGLWHMPVSAAPVSVYHEVRQGPYERDRDVEFAPWAPADDDAGAIAQYFEKLQALSEGDRNLRHR